MAKTKLKVIQIDAWADLDNLWTYNDAIPICTVEVNGEPTTRKILTALRNINLLRPESIYVVDDYLSYENTWTVQRKNDLKPLFDMVIINDT